jgi:hypothetical protein
MRTNDIEFNRLKIEEAVIEVFFKEIKDVIKKYNEKELKSTGKEFNDAVENVNKIIETNLNDKLNDIKNAETLIEVILKNIRKASFDSCLKKFIDSLDDAYLLPLEFQAKCDQVFENKNESLIYQYITEPATHMLNDFTYHFKSKLEVKLNYLMNYLKMILNERSMI